MVNHALTSPPLWYREAPCGGRFRRPFMSSPDRRPMTATASQASPVKAEGRSPFVRLHELLADIKPGKPAINLSVGEPQHPIPAFVGPHDEILYIKKF